MEKKIAERSFEAERHSQISYSRPSYAAYYPKGGAADASAFGAFAAKTVSHVVMPGGSVVNQNNIGCRKESWRPPPSRQLDEQDNLAYVKPKSHPVYNGMRESDILPGTYYLRCVKKSNV